MSRTNLGVVCVGHIVVFDLGLLIRIIGEFAKVVVLLCEVFANRAFVREKRDNELARFEYVQYSLDQIRIVILWCIGLKANVRARRLWRYMNSKIISLKKKKFRLENLLMKHV
jgi:hypothetical protein